LWAYDDGLSVFDIPLEAIEPVRARVRETGQRERAFPSDEQRTPEGVRAFHKNDIEKWWPIIKAGNIKAE
jgi:hypothetical protein